MRAAILCVPFLAAACATAPEPPVWQPLSVENADYIRLGEGPCFGACPVYELTLYPTGQYVLMGERFTEGEARAASKPAEDSFDRAKEILIAAGFMDLPEDITTNNPDVCPNPPTDFATAEITVGRADGFYRTVRYYQGCRHDVAETALRQLRAVMRISDLVQAAGPE